MSRGFRFWIDALHSQVSASHVTVGPGVRAESGQEKSKAKVFAFSEAIDHIPLPREFYEHFADTSPGAEGFEDCASLFAHLENKGAVAEEFPIRHFQATQQSLGKKDLCSVYWQPGLEDPADRLTKVMCDMVPLPRLLGSPLRLFGSRE